MRVNRRWAKMEHLVESDATINGGNSGGALLPQARWVAGANAPTVDILDTTKDRKSTRLNSSHRT